MIKCEKCGAEVMDGALFCTECGAPLTQPFETDVKPVGNPFAEFEANVPKPELASADTSSLIFDEPDWRKAEKIEAQAEAAQELADETAAEIKAQAAASAATSVDVAENISAEEEINQAYSVSYEDVKAQAEEQTANGQKGFFDSFKEGMAGEEEKQQGAWGAANQNHQNHQNYQNHQQGFDPNPNNQQASWSPNIYNQDYMDMPQGRDKMWAILSYFWLILWIIAFFAGAVNGRRSNFLNHHLNQSLILSIVSTIAGWIGGTIGWAVGVIVFVFGIMGIVYAAQGSTKPLPIIGNLKIFR